MAKFYAQSDRSSGVHQESQDIADLERGLKRKRHLLQGDDPEAPTRPGAHDQARPGHPGRAHLAWMSSTPWKSGRSSSVRQGGHFSPAVFHNMLEIEFLSDGWA